MTHTYDAYKRPTSGQKTYTLKAKSWKQIFQTNRQGKKARVAILTSDKRVVKTRDIKRDPEGHYIIIKGRLHQEDINIVNIYAPNIGTLKYIKKILEDFQKKLTATQSQDILTPHCQKLTDLPNKISTKILWH